MRSTRVQECLLNKLGFRARSSANKLGQSPRRNINMFNSRKGESTMNRLLKNAIALGVVSGFALCAQGVNSAGVGYMAQAKVMSEYKGVKLGMKRDAVKAAMGNPASSSDTSDEFNLTGDDKMMVHYDNEEVKAIQLAFSDPKNAPHWKEVVGDAEVSETPNGAKTARKIMEAEKFWVSIYQTKDGATTRITISR